MSRIKALIFDVDGTLMDTEELHRQAFNQVFLDFKLGWNWSPGLYTELLNQSGGADRIGAYIQRLGLSAAETSYLRQIVPMVHRAKTLIYTDLIADAAPRPRPGVARLIDEAISAKVEVGLVATSAFRDLRGLVRAALGEEVAAVLGPVVCAEYVAHKKPAPDLYLLALNMLRLPAAACVAFEDSANGVAAAKAASLFTVATPSRWTRTQRLAAADLVLSTLGDPDRPLDERDSAMIGGGRYLELRHIEVLLDSTQVRAETVNGVLAAAPLKGLPSTG